MSEHDVLDRLRDSARAVPAPGPHLEAVRKRARTLKTRRWSGIVIASVVAIAAVVIPLRILWPLGDRDKVQPVEVGPSPVTVESSPREKLWLVLDEAQNIVGDLRDRVDSVVSGEGPTDSHTVAELVALQRRLDFLLQTAADLEQQLPLGQEALVELGLPIHPGEPDGCQNLLWGEDGQTVCLTPLDPSYAQTQELVARLLGERPDAGRLMLILGSQGTRGIESLGPWAGLSVGLGSMTEQEAVAAGCNNYVQAGKDIGFCIDRFMRDPALAASLRDAISSSKDSWPSPLEIGIVRLLGERYRGDLVPAAMRDLDGRLEILEEAWLQAAPVATPPSAEPSPGVVPSPTPSPDQGPGSSLYFEKGTYLPGERAQAGAKVRVWRGQNWEEGPFDVYLVPGTRPLWYHHLPKHAVRVGRLTIRRDGPWPPHRDEATLVAGTSFTVPRLAPGPYAVWVCNTNCRTGFGDLAYGQIEIAAPSGS